MQVSTTRFGRVWFATSRVQRRHNALVGRFPSEEPLSARASASSVSLAPIAAQPVATFELHLGMRDRFAGSQPFIDQIDDAQRVESG